MTEFNPYKSDTIDALPHNFLGVDPSLVASSAAKRRSMQDLRAGQDRLHANFIVETRIGGVQAQESPEAIRQINRGAVLAQLLLEYSKPNFDDRSMDVFMNRLGSGSSETRDPFTVAHQDLKKNRKRTLVFDGDDAVEARNAFTAQLDTVLTRAGLAENIEEAIKGLVGPEFGAPTLEPEARYGAAIVALAIGFLEYDR